MGSSECYLGNVLSSLWLPFQVDADIGSSTVANGVLSLVFGVVTSLVVDMAFLVQVSCVVAVDFLTFSCGSANPQIVFRTRCECVLVLTAS